MTTGRIKSAFAKPFHLRMRSVGFPLPSVAEPVGGGFVTLMPRTNSGTAACHCLVSADSIYAITQGLITGQCEVAAYRLIPDGLTIVRRFIAYSGIA